ncbi:metallopeptidase [Saccharothrix coeruleofusca]|uniref:DivIVA protein n=1 Tax=Saccharothrix coeruleofusca TaxID=33919 RepID=A0A918EF25_9PSEU|nr:metallopeptidase [Saccharothrix coeruleofusca]GGP70991.1 hypothetical protein GCM10010185_50010 [Saccharothrix coeruleofusca]
MALDPREELLPLRTDFDLAWRGYDRGQVQHYVRAAEADLRLLAADRDAAVARAEDLARQLEQARSQVHELTGKVDRLCRTPVDPDALSDRLRRMVELAHAEAAEVTAQARAAAEQTWTAANQAADRMRRRAEHLVAELEQRRRELEAEQRDLLARAHQQAQAVTGQAERRRRELDEQAARLREQVRQDFELAMTARRAEAARRAEELESAARARADQVVHDAEEHARRVVAEAQRRVDELRERRSRISDELRLAQQVLAGAAPLLEPLPEEELPELLPGELLSERSAPALELVVGDAEVAA